MNNWADLEMQWDDYPEIQNLADVGGFSNPEFPVLNDSSGVGLVFGLAIWRCDGHLDTPVTGDRW